MKVEAVQPKPSQPATEQPPDVVENWWARWSAAAELGERLVRRGSFEPFALRFVLVSQPVDQTQELTPHSQ